MNTIFLLTTKDSTQVHQFSTWNDAVSYAYNVLHCQHDYEFTIDEMADPTPVATFNRSMERTYRSTS